nr:hypothetical protein [Nocardioides glacieisoli]
MPELVRVEVGHADGSGRCTECGVKGAHPQRLTVADASEHQVVQLLALDVAPEIAGEELGDRDLASLMGLGSAPDKPQPLNGRHRLGDDGAVAAKVEPADPQRGHLAETDAGVAQEQHDKPVSLVRSSVEAAVLARIMGVAGRSCEVFDLLMCQVAVLGLAHARQVHATSDVARQPGVLDGHVEDEAEHAVDLLDGGGGAMQREFADPRLYVAV